MWQCHRPLEKWQVRWVRPRTFRMTERTQRPSMAGEGPSWEPETQALVLDAC